MNRDTSDIYEGRFLRHHQGLSFAARVWVRLACSTGHSDVRIDCHGCGWSGAQGDLDDVSQTGYDSWKAGAELGARFALRQTGRDDVVVTVIRILGRTAIDTNPTVVAAATADAVWKGLAFQPPQSCIDHLTATVFSSWETPHPDATLPDL